MFPFQLIEGLEQHHMMHPSGVCGKAMFSNNCWCILSFRNTSVALQFGILWHFEPCKCMYAATVTTKTVDMAYHNQNECWWTVLNTGQYHGLMQQNKPYFNYYTKNYIWNYYCGNWYLVLWWHKVWCVKVIITRLFNWSGHLSSGCYLDGCLGDSLQIDKPSIYITDTRINSAFHLSRM